MEAINRSNARLARALWTAGHSMSMMTNTLGRYFAGRFLVAAVGVFASIFVLLVLRRLHRNGPQDVRAGVGLRNHGGADVALPGCRNCSKS